MARPSRYTKALGDRICDRFAEGDTLYQIAEDPAMPSKRSILRWARTNDDFKPKYRAALEMKADLLHHLAEESLRLIHDRDSAAVARVRLDGYLRLAARIDPRRYNDKIVIRNGGERPGDAIQVDHNKATHSVREKLLNKLASMRNNADAVSLDMARSGDDRKPGIAEPIERDRALRRQMNPVHAAECEAKERAARAEFEAECAERFKSTKGSEQEQRGLAPARPVSPRRVQPPGTMARPEHVGGPASGGVIKEFGAGIRES